jgi:monothiol glutaredoxin
MPIDPATKSKLDQIVTSDAVVLFMKGNRSFPQCGFSASVVGILNTLIPKYTTVNVLSDPEVRDGMKQYSDWPTFPQLYVRGEFVGGADIIKQMSETGELAKKLGELVAPVAPPAIEISPRAAAELTTALREAGAGDVVHLTIPPSWDHQLDLGPKEPGHVTVAAGGLTVQLDPQSAQRAAGLVIDFVEGAGGAGFKLDNPNRPAQVRQAGPKELKAMLDAGTVTELLDCRTPKELAIARIDAGKLLDDAEMARVEGLPKSTPLAFYCHHGNRSQHVAEHFLGLGFTRVYNLKGGLEAWRLEVDPTVPRY